MFGYYVLLINETIGTSSHLGPYTWHNASGVAARAGRNEGVAAGVIGRRDGGSACPFRRRSGVIMTSV